MTEEWRAIPGYEGLYEVSSVGRVRSLDRRVRTGIGFRVAPGTVMVLKTKDTRRLQVHLSRANRKRAWQVHQLVALAFIGPKPGPGYMVLHWDDDPLHNRVENLRWGTRSENEHDRVRNGKNHQANKTHCVNGHRFAEANTRRDKHGWRHCRTCAQEQQKRRAKQPLPVEGESSDEA